MNLRVDGLMVASVLGVVAVGAGAYFIKKKGGALVDAVNPASSKNVVNQGANLAAIKIGLVDEGETIGSQIYNATHEPYDPNDPAWSADFSWSQTAKSVSPYLLNLTPATAAVNYLGSKAYQSSAPAAKAEDVSEFLSYLNPVTGLIKSSTKVWEWATQ